MPLPVKSVDCLSQRLWMTVIRTWHTRFTFVALCGETQPETGESCCIRGPVQRNASHRRGRRGRHEVQARHKRAYSPLAATSS